MTATRTVLVCIAAFVAGGAVGGYAFWFMGERATAQAIANDAAAGVGAKTHVLEVLRSGDASKAGAMLETMLDSDLVVLGLVPETTINPPMRRAIDRAAEYRSRYPHKSGEPTVDEEVSRVLTPSSSGRK